MKFNIDGLNKLEKEMLDIVKDYLKIEYSLSGIKLFTEIKESGFTICKKNSEIVISYAKKNDFFRALSVLKANNGKQDLNITQEPKFKKMTLMADCARNAVMKVETVKKLAVYMALLGFNSLQLYSEDSMEVENEPYYGYLRGRYTSNEIKEIDNFCNKIGIELVPCIQTLAHLEGLLHWQPYQDVFDANDILLVDNEKTYILLENIIKTARENFASNNINIGMDEAFLLGSGQFFQKKGFIPKFEIFKKHLDKVLEICDKYDFKVSMWSDMFFRNLFNKYYETNKELPKNAKNQVPNNVELIYWDYYSLDENHYKKMIENHSQLCDNFSFAGGAWKWVGFAPLTSYSLATSKAALKSCVGKIDNIMLTAWGDNGGECSIFSIMPVLALYTQCNYSDIEDDKELKKTFKSIFDLSFDNFLKLENANKIGTGNFIKETNNSSKYFLYNDLLLGVFDSNVDFDTKEKFYENYKLLKRIKTKSSKFGYLYDTLSALCDLNSYKCELGLMIKKAYDEKDKLEIYKIATSDIPLVIKKLKIFYKSFQRQWYIENKGFGFEIQDIRIGGLIYRIEKIKKTLLDFYNEKIEKIDELEEQKLDFMGRKDFSKDKDILYNNFANTFSASKF